MASVVIMCVSEPKSEPIEFMETIERELALERDGETRGSSTFHDTIRGDMEDNSIMCDPYQSISGLYVCAQLEGATVGITRDGIASRHIVVSSTRVQVKASDFSLDFRFEVSVSAFRIFTSTIT